MSTSFADRKKTATPAESTVHLCLDLQLHDRRREAYQQFEQLREAAKRGTDEPEQTTLDSPRQDDALTAQLTVLDEIDAELNAKSEPYTLRKLNAHQWRDLGEQYPAVQEDVDRIKAERAEMLTANPDMPARLLPVVPDVDPETFWPAAISACAHDPELSVDDVLWLRDGDDEWSGLPPDEFRKLMIACQELHSSGVQVPKELLRIVATMSRAPNGTTPAAKASRSRSSGAASHKTAKRTG